MSIPSSAPLPPQAWLELPDGQLFWLGARTTIGRQTTSDLVLTDTTLSRQHAVITREGRDTFIADLQSRNGTFVGEIMLSHPALLHDGDRIRLGAFALRFRCLRLAQADHGDAGDGQTTRALPRVETIECWLAVASRADAESAKSEARGDAAVLRWREWITGLRPLLEQHGAQIAWYATDSVLAYWAGPAGKPSDVLASARAVNTWREHSPLPFRLALHHGRVLLAHTEHGHDVAGGDIDFAVRMNAVAQSFGAHAILSAAAARTLGVEDRCAALGPAAGAGLTGFSAYYALPSAASAVLPPEDSTGWEPSTESSKAVFLSYASQDAPAVRRLCEALRATNVEVWLDQSDLHGGDAWDQKIRRQVKACALFIPIISANTQSRREGYFRIEWKLAAQRTHAIADGVPFLLPVVIDATTEGVALVPPEFRDVQWTRLHQANDFAAFAQRVRGLLGPADRALASG